ncbi:MAG: DUF4369 domain-containing protein [Bacteroidota bacterium]
MRNLFYLGWVLLLFSCGKNSGESTIILNGEVKGLKKGTLYLQKVSDTTLVTIDSLLIQGDGNFRFSVPLESPEVLYLYLDKKDNNTVNDRITFFGEAGEMTINTTWNAFVKDAEIMGSETHKKFEEYRKVMSRFNAKDLELIRYASNPEAPLDSLQMDSVQNNRDMNLKRSYAFALNFALNNKNSAIAPYIAMTEVADANKKYLDSIYESLNPEVAASKYGKELKAYLEGI